MNTSSVSSACVDHQMGFCKAAPSWVATERGGGWSQSLVTIHSRVEFKDVSYHAQWKRHSSATSYDEEKLFETSSHDSSSVNGTENLALFSAPLTTMVKVMPAPFFAVSTTMVKMMPPRSSPLFSSMYTSYHSGDFIKHPQTHPHPHKHTCTQREDEPSAHELAFFLLSSSAWASAFLIMFSISSLDRPPEDWITTETAQTLLLAINSLQILVVFLNICNWRNISKSRPNQMKMR